MTESPNEPPKEDPNDIVADLGFGLNTRIGSFGNDDEPDAMPGTDVLGASPGYIPRGRPRPGFAPARPSDVGFGPNQPYDVYIESNAIDVLRKMSPIQLAEFQETLAVAGVLREGGYRSSIPDEKTEKALQEVMGLANRTGKTWQETTNTLFLESTKAEMARQRQAAAARPKFTANVSNPDELRGFFNDMAVEMTGSSETQIDVDKMVKAYQATERNYQAKQWNASVNNTGGTIEEPVSAELFAEQALQEAAPDQVQANSVAERAGQLFGMLGQFGGM